MVTLEPPLVAVSRGRLFVATILRMIVFLRHVHYGISGERTLFFVESTVENLESPRQGRSWIRTRDSM